MCIRDRYDLAAQCTPHGKSYIVNRQIVHALTSVSYTHLALLAEGFEAELRDGIEVSHKDKRDADIATDVAQLFEKQAEGHRCV